MPAFPQWEAWKAAEQEARLAAMALLSGFRSSHDATTVGRLAEEHANLRAVAHSLFGCAMLEMQQAARCCSTHATQLAHHSADRHGETKPQSKAAVQQALIAAGESPAP